jgi:AAA15 family ATPase/GTPase
VLKRLILHNFKSIASASIDFTPFTFLVGRNGSGKSNIADALAFLAETTNGLFRQSSTAAAAHSA